MENPVLQSNKYGTQKLHKKLTYFVDLTDTPVVSNSITLVLGSNVVPGGAPPGPLISGLRLALVM